ncbi:MAG: type II toxin-antitoxin system HicA family toxin [Candidatus Micrarchaeota archaeon]
MKLPVLSGMEIAKLLSKAGFAKLDQTGSHLIMVKEKEGRKFKPVVPMHKEVFVGTLISIIKQAGMTREEFLRRYKKHR